MRQLPFLDLKRNLCLELKTNQKCACLHLGLRCTLKHSEFKIKLSQNVLKFLFCFFLVIVRWFWHIFANNFFILILKFSYILQSFAQMSPSSWGLPWISYLKFHVHSLHSSALFSSNSFYTINHLLLIIYYTYFC